MAPGFDAATLTSLALALGLGLLIGIERERSKGSGPTRRFAGIRTFALASLTGAGAQVLEQAWLTAVAGALVAGLAIVSHVKDRSRDPGITTEIALFLTFLLGMLSVPEPALASALGVTVAVLLVARVPLQRFSTQVLGEQELRDALLLAASALVVLPLAPNQALPWLGGINLRMVWQLVVLIMVVQALGHVALRLFGSRLGLPLSGLVAGFVSSTATIAAMGTRAARHPELRSACVAGAWFSTVSTALQVMLIAGLLYPAGLPLIAPTMGSALLMALLLGLGAYRRSALPPDETPTQGRAFSLRQSILLALLFTGIAVAVAWLQQGVGTMGTLVATGLAGLADAHSSAAAAMSLAARGEIEPSTMLTAVLLAFSTNNLSKIVAAYATGGVRYGSIVSAGLVVVALVAWACSVWLRLVV